MTDQELREKLIAYMEEASPMFESEGLADDDSIEDAGLDSLDIVNFLLSIEENLSVKIADSELPDLNTLSDFMARVKKDL